MRIQILKLYKDLLRYGERLEYTDKSFFRRKIRQNFRQNSKLVESDAIQFQFEKGLTLLKDQRVV